MIPGAQNLPGIEDARRRGPRCAAGRPALTVLCVLAAAAVLRAAVGCDLNDPDRDVKRLFPDSTGYKTLYVSIAKKGGDALLKEIEARLGDTFKGLFETADVPYTMYQIYKGQELIGYIHGVNQKGTYGGLQVFLALDPAGVIRGFYLQKLTSKAARLFREPAFGRQFVGLSLADFDRYDVLAGKETPPGPVSRVKNPDPGSEADFRAILRAAKKNLILVDEFLLGNIYLKSPERTKGAALEKTLSATRAGSLWQGQRGAARSQSGIPRWGIPRFSEGHPPSPEPRVAEIFMARLDSWRI